LLIGYLKNRTEKIFDLLSWEKPNVILGKAEAETQKTKEQEQEQNKKKRRRKEGW